MKQRNHAFDLLCGLCIIRMICLHIMQFCGRAQVDWWQEVMAWSFFFMCFFFFKAGYFNKSLAGNTRDYVRDKAKRLLIPYITCGLIGDAVYFAFLPTMLERYHRPIEPLSWPLVWERSSFFGNTPCWFLFSFFSAYVLLHLLAKRRGLMWVTLAFPLVSYALFRLGNPLWMSLNNVFMGVFFFVLGRLWHTAMDWMGARRTVWVSLGLLALFVAGNILWHGEYTMNTNKFEGNALGAVLNTMVVLCGLSGLLIAGGLPRVPVVSYIGEHSMVYFISHYPMLYFYKFTHLAFGRSIFGRWDDAIILIPVIFGLCSWLVPYVERVPWLSGRWPKKKISNEQTIIQSAGTESQV